MAKSKGLVALGPVVTLSLIVSVISVRINLFRYDNFDFGKFDLGNMAQMLWNTLHGRFMYLTDYFGGNVPRWSMSHVDPILALITPIFTVFPHPLTLVFVQLALTTIVAPIVLYKIAKLETHSSFVASAITISYLLYPALGYLNTQTGFHGVSAAIPFFLLTYYFLAKMYQAKVYSKVNLIGLWLSALITMTGKEQLPIYILILSLFGLVTKVQLPEGRAFSLAWLKAYVKNPLALNLLVLGGVSLAWFLTAFLIIIPKYASYRIESYRQFTQEVGIDTSLTKDVIKSNYFLGRYEEFGDSYLDIISGMFANPKVLVSVVFGGDKLDNFVKTFGPLGFLSFAGPQMLATAVPDLLINYGTTAGGIGTSEISNHRISMIIPVVFLAAIIGIQNLSRLVDFIVGGLAHRKGKHYTPNKYGKYVVHALALLIVVTGLITTYSYNNPVFLWFTQAVAKRITPTAQAKTDDAVGLKQDIKLGDRFKISSLENKDRECAQKIINMIPKDASVSGPDYLGAHLALRETYAIFPALYSKADYVIVDVFSQKIMRILDADVSLVRDVVGDMVKNPSYTNIAGCGNLFVFKRTSNGGKENKLLPIQEKYHYPKNLSLEIFQGLYLADFMLPKQVTRGVPSEAYFVYVKQTNESGSYVLFTTLINTKTGEIYQSANIPSYGILNLDDWMEDYYYIETIDLSIPQDVKPGTYHAFIGMTNNIRTRSIYLQDVEVK